MSRFWCFSKILKINSFYRIFKKWMIYSFFKSLDKKHLTIEKTNELKHTTSTLIEEKNKSILIKILMNIAWNSQGCIQKLKIMMMINLTILKKIEVEGMDQILSIQWNQLFTLMLKIEKSKGKEISKRDRRNTKWAWHLSLLTHQDRAILVHWMALAMLKIYCKLFEAVRRTKMLKRNESS